MNRHQSHWTVKTLYALEELNIGWVKAIKTTLQNYNPTVNFQEIKAMPRPLWIQKTKAAIESKHIERLIDQCHKTTEGIKTVKTKTASIVPVITASNYKRKPQYAILRTSKHETRTIMMARYGILECGNNYRISNWC